MRRPALLLVAGALLAGCGGGDPELQPDGPPPPEAAQAAIERWRDAREPGQACDALATPALVDAVWGSADACRARAAAVREPDRFEVLDVQVRGDRATARVEVAAPDFPVETTVEAVRDGDGWKVDRVGPEYLPATLDRRLRTSRAGALAAPGAAECLSQGDPMRVAQQARGADEASLRELGRGLRRCPGLVKDFVIEVTVQAYASDAPDRVRDCVRRDLRAVTIDRSRVLEAAFDDDLGVFAGFGRTSARVCARQARARG